ncbi:ATP-binding protein [Plantibacter sp. VKM Ac-2876]|uniref:ATP-binding protein n=1 Tax=Plantibacter sp. VKM Ac-2876 TaxID=2783826 RepID=UPI00188A4652|nr:ATP-binding protein [Plantibacter sp. VKM Ac-2876]MBF4566002.1 ATP-binding protein [Plantibacter sp. VKM Ac-2876]
MASLTEQDERFNRERLIRGAFSPTAPISRRDLFAGRVSQLMALIDGADAPGQHLVLFGERGVGKTSLANIAVSMLGVEALSVRINCTTSDTFSDLWVRAFDEIQLTQMHLPTGFGSEPVSRPTSVLELIGGPEALSVDQVRAALFLLTRDQPVVVFFDEFDRLEDEHVHLNFADCIKTLSDQAVPATVVIVGVADDVNDLIDEHASVERALGQIPMPRMSDVELADLLARALASVDMTISDAASRRIVKVSQGLPHYTHLLGQEAALGAFRTDSSAVGVAAVDYAIERAIDRTQESIAALYYRATYSARENLYKQVLLACAMAQSDDRGFFSAASVRESLSLLLGRRMEIPSFAMHLNAFSTDRGPVLRKEGAQRKFRYRFVNPLLQPYVLLRGVRDGLIQSSMLGQ